MDGDDPFERPARPPGNLWNPLVALRRLYEWVLEWSTSPYALPALVVVAFTESSFFPVPPDVLLVAMAMAQPAKSFLYAFWCTVGSVAGGVLGYGIGIALMEGIGCPLVRLYHGERTFDWLAHTFRTYDFWAVFLAAVTPIPYKIFTITAGAVEASFGTFLLASALGRPARFFAVAALLYFLGPPVKRFIDRYFEALAIAFAVLLVAGFAALDLAGGRDDGRGRPGGPPPIFASICGD